ncbi:hypothetical protein DLE60_13025 [Micromonospora globispora]|uniref:Uncharacterized protein n=1 Tax=Micromonospora globispora TaxID=1450148 RepID=A0A317K2U9_9ACTN|nr:hypothetical protein [Micromonospora globispora]PWU47256.1 hypothetical protein DLJ46_15305 [Micromonospora globispora]PWU60080.1 hypothetical protein DLE60_13025 [Micromonospora globispora]RQW94895.1 hypothetical protein DKL51_15465 [Micromonospora globispora]
MAQQQERSQQQADERERRERDAERARNWADEAAEARTADDPRAMAPRDAGGRPSNGRQF